MKAQWNGPNRFDVPRDDLTGPAVPTGHTFGRQSIFIKEGDAQAIDLRFGNVVDRIGLRKFQNTAVPRNSSLE